jgi:hypothetical protein
MCQGALRESAKLLAKAKEWELLTAFFLIMLRTAQKKRGNVARCWGCANVQIASESNILKLKKSLCVNPVCKNFDDTFLISTKRHPNAIDGVVGMPKKVYWLTLEG